MTESGHSTDQLWEETAQSYTNTEEETDKKCPACGGTMDFAPQKGCLVCPYCGTEEAIELSEEPFIAEELDFNLLEDDDSCDWGTATRTVVCKACGAETVYDFNQTASECPYCGSNQILEQEQTANVMAPGGVVPFQISAKESSDLFRRWIKGRFFCPGKAKEQAKPDAFQGVYLPYWTFDSQTQSSYTGEYGVTRTYRSSDGKTRSKTTWYHTGGHLSRAFDDILVCGSARQNASMVESIEPFDTGKTVEYQPEYLAGFIAERYSVKPKTAWETARSKMASLLKQDAENQIQNRHGSFLTRNIFVRTTHSHVTYKYILLPVYLSSFRYNGKTYHFIVNGQTGRTNGETPVSWVKVALTVLAFLLLFGLIHLGLNADAAMVSKAAALYSEFISILL